MFLRTRSLRQWLTSDRPPMQEGHHVTGVSDLVGTEAQDNIRNDSESWLKKSIFKGHDSLQDSAQRNCSKSGENGFEQRFGQHVSPLQLPLRAIILAPLSKPVDSILVPHGVAIPPGAARVQILRAPSSAT